MRPIETIKLDNRTVTVNAIQCVATVRIDVYYDTDLSIDDLEPEEPYRSKLLRDLERNDAMVAWIKVTATIDGIDGTDTIGGVVIYKPEDLTETVADNGMVDNAVDAAIQELTETSKRLSKYVKE